MPRPRACSRAGPPPSRLLQSRCSQMMRTLKRSAKPWPGWQGGWRAGQGPTTCCTCWRPCPSKMIRATSSCSSSPRESCCPPCWPCILTRATHISCMRVLHIFLCCLEALCSTCCCQDGDYVYTRCLEASCSCTCCTHHRRADQAPDPLRTADLTPSLFWALLYDSAMESNTELCCRSFKLSCQQHRVVTLLYAQTLRLLHCVPLPQTQSNKARQTHYAVVPIRLLSCNTRFLQLGFTPAEFAVIGGCNPKPVTGVMPPFEASNDAQHDSFLVPFGFWIGDVIAYFLSISIVH